MNCCDCFRGRNEERPTVFLEFEGAEVSGACGVALSAECEDVPTASSKKTAKKSASKKKPSKKKRNKSSQPPEPKHLMEVIALDDFLKETVRNPEAEQKMEAIPSILMERSPLSIRQFFVGYNNDPPPPKPEPKEWKPMDIRLFFRDTAPPPAHLIKQQSAPVLKTEHDYTPVEQFLKDSTADGPVPMLKCAALPDLSAYQRKAMHVSSPAAAPVMKGPLVVVSSPSGETIEKQGSPEGSEADMQLGSEAELQLAGYPVVDPETNVDQVESPEEAEMQEVEADLKEAEPPAEMPVETEALLPQVPEDTEEMPEDTEEKPEDTEKKPEDTESEAPET